MQTTTPRRADRHVRHDRPRRTSLLVLFVALAGIVGALVMASRYYEGCQGAGSGPAREVAFTVDEGATAEQVVDGLASEGVIPCGGFVGNLLMRGTGKAGELRAGTYPLSTQMTLDEAVEVLTTAPKKIPTADLLIPPGFRITQIAEAVDGSLGIPADEFLTRVQKGTFDRPPALGANAPLEGFLWPETYRIPRRDDADAVIQRLLNQFTEETADLPWDNAHALGVTPYEVVVIASMIEKEAAVQRDRPLIAGVIYNRLRDGMALGIDATLLYDDPTPDGELSTADIETDGPYNTRLRAGLPPTPIASPYLWSLKAALNPAETPYYYYVLCGDDGGHRFAVTYDEHLTNVDECLG
ncbi:MAG: endolytic transglycosylase MltG [Actinomycetota bacterium]|nr:endolytic transglycosylase MltG [Actinomycetota bacterium]MDH5225133.1 endolytic transglycosylase MltG [Actinomycetota bacterium]MDH5313599.1 endolytic transglycosylase MltG [Actinomycetota bacterium]